MEQRRSRHYNWGSADRLLSIEDDRYGLTQYRYSPSGELTMATYADCRKVQNLCWNIDGTCQQKWSKVSSTARIAPL